jgi:hypothetical protein
MRSATQHPFPESFRFVLLSRLGAALRGSFTGFVFVDKPIGVKELNALCELRCGVSWNIGSPEHLYAKEEQRIEQDYGLTQVIEHSYISALLLLGELRGLHKGKAGVAEFYVTDISRDGDHWTARYGVRFVPIRD